MTTNLGSQVLLETLERKKEKLTKELILTLLDPILKNHFRPEFLNRLDDILPFLPLKEEDMSKIVDIQLQLLRKRLLDRDIAVSWSEGLVHYLAKEGYDPLFGARPLKRLIQEAVLNPLSKQILEGKIISGEKVRLDWKKDQLETSKE
jgi:ATP-dependent Clp protease ATP-binding subunit ClpB